MKEKLTNFLEQTSKHNFDDLWLWSQKNPLDFWRSLWDGCNIIGEKGNSDYQSCNDFPYTIWYPDSKINYAANILHTRDETIALIVCEKGGKRQAITRAKLYAEVSRNFTALKNLQIKAGDVVVGILPPGLAAITLLLAVAAHGAIWCGIDLPSNNDFALSPSANIQGVSTKDNLAISRILQKLLLVNPQLIICDSGIDNLNDQQFTLLLNKINAAQPNSLLLPFSLNNSELQQIFPNDWLSFQRQQKVKQIDFYPSSFSYPLIYHFSEGVTGKVKLFCHSHGSIVMQHFKEQQLECELDHQDTLLYLTRIDQIMWLWTISLIAHGVRLVVGDFATKITENSPILTIAEEENITHLGIYTQNLKHIEFEVISKSKIPLKTLICTSSTLHQNQLKKIQANLPKLEILNLYTTSETMSSFAISKKDHETNEYKSYSDPTILRPCLGIVLNSANINEHIDQDNLDFARSNLLCALPFPGLSFSLKHDLDNQLYWQNYYQSYPGKWSLNDILLWQSDDSFTCLGGKINSSVFNFLSQEDIRILIENEEEVSDCFLITPEMLLANYVINKEQQHSNFANSWVVFVQIKNQYLVNHQLQEKINNILTKVFPINVDCIILVAELIYSRSGKIMANTVAKLVAGNKLNEVGELDVANPDDLGYFRNIYQLKDWPNQESK